jgi:hypothetical protein
VNGAILKTAVILLFTAFSGRDGLCLMFKMPQPQGSYVVDVDYLQSWDNIANRLNLDHEAEIVHLRAVPNGREVAFAVESKVEDKLESLFFRVNLNKPSDIKIIDQAAFYGYAGQEAFEKDGVIKEKLKGFVELNFKSHPGMLGGTVFYGLSNICFSPGGEMVVFLVVGYDGHRAYYPHIFLADSEGESIVLVDLASRDICEDVAWISGDSFIYSKDNILWQASVKGWLNNKLDGGF